MSGVYVQNVINHNYPKINSHYIVINMYPYGISPFTLRMPHDASIAKRMVLEFNPSLGEMAKNS